MELSDGWDGYERHPYDHSIRSWSALFSA